MLPNYRNLCFVLAVILGCFAAARAESIKGLKPNGYVNDFADVLDTKYVLSITRICSQVDQKQKAQIAVVTVHSLEGISIEKYGHDLFNQWGIGPKATNYGVLILMAMEERRWRIQVGRGLESTITNATAAHIGTEAVPLLKERKYGEAMELMTRRVAETIITHAGLSPDIELATPTPAPASAPLAGTSGPQEDSSSVMSIIAFLLVLVVVVIVVVWVLRRSGQTAQSRSYPAPQQTIYSTNYYVEHPSGIFSEPMSTSYPRRYYGDSGSAPPPPRQSEGTSSGSSSSAEQFSGFDGGSTGSDSGSSGSFDSSSSGSESSSDSGSSGSFDSDSSSSSNSGSSGSFDSGSSDSGSSDSGSSDSGGSSDS